MEDDFKTFVTKNLSVLFICMGIYPNSAGWSHLMDAVYLAAKRGVYGISVCRLYAEVGKAVHKSGVAVERAIRNAISKCENEGRMKKLNDYFGYEVYSEKYPIRSGELISILATKMLDDYSVMNSAAQSFAVNSSDSDKHGNDPMRAT